jgi:hypothetical protein
LRSLGRLNVAGLMQAKGTTAVRLLVCDLDSQWALGRLLHVQCPADEVRIASVHMRWPSACVCQALACAKHLRVPSTCVCQALACAKHLRLPSTCVCLLAVMISYLVAFTVSFIERERAKGIWVCASRPNASAARLKSDRSSLSVLNSDLNTRRGKATCFLAMGKEHAETWQKH